MNYMKHRDVLYPPVLHGIIWSSVVILYLVSSGLFFIPLSLQLYFLIISGLVMFSVGSLMVTFKCRPANNFVASEVAIKENMFLKAIFWLPILGLPFYLYKAYSLGISGPLDNHFFYNLRFFLSASRYRESYGLLAYLGTLSIVSAGLQFLVAFQNQKKSRVLIAIGVAAVYTVFSTGRTSVFMFLIFFVGLLVITRQLSIVKGFLLFAVTGLVVFVTIGALTFKGVRMGSGLFENALSMLDNMRAYLLSSLPAFDIYMHSNIPIGYGENMLRFLFVILNKLGLDVSPVLLAQQFVAVPVLTNVYTIYQPYYADFSIFGALLIQFFLGLWHGFLYLKARLNKPLYIILYALFLYPLFMQFFQDQYFNLLSTWMQCFIVLFLYFFISAPQGPRGVVDGKPGYHHRELERRIAAP